VGALAIGSASPHLVRALGGISDWHRLLYTTSLLALAGGVLTLVAGQLGPHTVPREHVFSALRSPDIHGSWLFLANLVIWDTCGSCTRCGLGAALLLQAYGGDMRPAAIASFAVIGVGSLGSAWAAGWRIAGAVAE